LIKIWNLINEGIERMTLFNEECNNRMNIHNAHFRDNADFSNQHHEVMVRNQEGLKITINENEEKLEVIKKTNDSGEQIRRN
jgi:hypothetical protein